MDFDLENTRRKLIAMRDKHGADTPAGHRCSNIIEQLQNRQGATSDQLSYLAKNIQRQMAGLAQHAEEGKSHEQIGN